MILLILLVLVSMLVNMTKITIKKKKKKLDDHRILLDLNLTLKDLSKLNDYNST